MVSTEVDRAELLHEIRELRDHVERLQARLEPLDRVLELKRRRAPSWIREVLDWVESL